MSRYSHGTAKRKAPQQTKTSVYFIRAATTGHIKIGVAERPEQRLRDLQTANPDRLTIINSIECVSRSMAMALEGYIHLHFDQYAAMGEWFAITKTQVDDLIALLSMYADATRGIEDEPLQSVANEWIIDMSIALELARQDDERRAALRPLEWTVIKQDKAS
jgi:hypothetical protein